MSGNKCIVCNQKAEIAYNYNNIITCPSCGKYVITDQSLTISQFGSETILKYNGDLDKLASFLYYNNHDSGSSICFMGSLDGYKNIVTEISRCKYITPDLVESWYPKTFNEQIDMFLIAVYEKLEYRSKKITLSWEDIFSATFVKRRNSYGNLVSETDIRADAQYILSYLQKEKYTTELYDVNPQCVNIGLYINALFRIDEAQKKLITNSKNVFIAMSFAGKMKDVREAIKSAITECGFIPVLIDEVEHNKQIVPEMLYEIRKSKFIIAELTGHNNGAYFEAGYALGCGKEVIQLCKKDSFEEDGHFDVKQINTVLWETEADLKDKLIKRIKATVMQSL